jgi:hypothetical protein
MASLNQIKMMVDLARIDGEVVEREKQYIFNIGRANGFAEAAVEPLFERTHNLSAPEKLSSDQKFDYLFSLITLMKIDERLYQDEIKYCSRMATKLGYDSGVTLELVTRVKISGMTPAEVGELRRLAHSHLQEAG